MSGGTPETTMWLTLEGLANARDVGGLPLAGGGTTRGGVLLRSDEPVACTPADVAQLVEVVGLRRVVDLRSLREHETSAPHALRDAGVEYLSLSLRDRASTTEDRAASRAEADGLSEDDLLVWMARRYRQTLDVATEALIGLLPTLAHQDGPTLVHCAAGKDRTGVVVAMLLSLAGVERPAVVADYAVTDGRMDRVLAALRARRGPGIDELPPVLHRAPARVMDHFLASVDEDLGGVERWFLDRGARPADVVAWTERLAAPA
ncbi:MAG: tyrosine-protein phosphatase [Acidimicrobiia bacterium]